MTVIMVTALTSSSLWFRGIRDSSRKTRRNGNDNNRYNDSHQSVESYSLQNGSYSFSQETRQRMRETFNFKHNTSFCCHPISFSWKMFIVYFCLERKSNTVSMCLEVILFVKRVWNWVTGRGRRHCVRNPHHSKFTVLLYLLKRVFFFPFVITIFDSSYSLWCWWRMKAIAISHEEVISCYFSSDFSSQRSGRYAYFHQKLIFNVVMSLSLTLRIRLQRNRCLILIRFISCVSTDGTESELHPPSKSNSPSCSPSKVLKNSRLTTHPECLNVFLSQSLSLSLSLSLFVFVFLDDETFLPTFGVND
jgi:hypothetical protein